MKLALYFKTAYFFCQFEFCRQKLPEHDPECFEQLYIKRMPKIRPQKAQKIKRQRVADLRSAQGNKSGAN